MDPLAGGLAVNAVHRYARSAQPDAPVVPDRPRRRRPSRRPRHPGRVRRQTASGLRRLADRLEPCPAASLR